MSQSLRITQSYKSHQTPRLKITSSNNKLKKISTPLIEKSINIRSSQIAQKKRKQDFIKKKFLNY